MSRRAVIYARTTATGRGGDALLEADLAACRRYAQEQGLEVREELVDRAHAHHERDAYERVVKLAEARDIDVVVVRNLHALTPGLLEFTDVVRTLGKHEVKIQMVERMPWMKEIAEGDQ